MLSVKHIKKEGKESTTLESSCLHAIEIQAIADKKRVNRTVNWIIFFLLKRVSEPKNHKTDWITYILIAGAWFISIFMAHKFRSVCTHMDSSCYFNQPTRIFHLSYTSLVNGIQKSYIYSNPLWLFSIQRKNS